MRIKSGWGRGLCVGGLFVITTGFMLGANVLRGKEETTEAIAVLIIGTALFLLAFYLLFRWDII